MISFRFVMPVSTWEWNKHSGVILINGVWMEKQHDLCVYSFQHVQLIILKVFFFKEGGTGPKAILNMVQIQRRKYSFEKKVSFCLISKLTYGERVIVCNVYNHHQIKRHSSNLNYFFTSKTRGLYWCLCLIFKAVFLVYGFFLVYTGIYSLMVYKRCVCYSSSYMRQNCN